MILQSMLQRLYSSLQKGPSLNARPHNSRQRVDLVRFADFQEVSQDAILPCILGTAKKLTLPASVSPFRKPEYPEEEWSDEQKDVYTELLQQYQASVLASLDYVRLLYATLFGYLIFSTLPDAATWLGAGVIVAASLYTVHRERQLNKLLARSPDGRGYNT